MSNFTIDSRDGAVEAAAQYKTLGLPLPTDLVAYLADNGIILTDDTEVTEETFNPYEQE